MRLKNTRTITYRRSDKQGKEIPSIIIEGKFLIKLGFCRGDKVGVKYEKGKITICKIKQIIIKPKCRLTGTDGNAFAILSRVLRALKDSGQYYKANEFRKQAISSKSYDELLNLCDKYVEIF